MSDILTAKESFWYTDESGESRLVHKGDRFREGHPVTVKLKEFFEVDSSVHEFEAPKRHAGRPRKESE